MTFPKPIMSLKELRDIGFPRQTLIEYTYIKDFPGFKTPGGGKWLVDTEKFSKWLESRKKRQHYVGKDCDV